MISRFEKTLITVAETYTRYRPQRPPNKKTLEQCKQISHRGQYDNQTIFENTLESFLPLIKQNVWGIEFDIRWSKDNIPIVSHDDNLSRLYHQNHKIAELNFHEIKAACPLVLSLEELILKIGDKLHYMMNLKDTMVVHNKKARDNLLDILSVLKAEDNFHVISFYLDNFDHLTAWPTQTFLPIAYLNTHTIEKNAHKKVRFLRQDHHDGQKLGSHSCYHILICAADEYHQRVNEIHDKFLFADKIHEIVASLDPRHCSNY